MNLLTKRFGLVLAGVIGVGAIATLALGASFALFSSQATSTSGTITAATVTLANDGSTTCSFSSNIEPGGPPTTCTYTVSYSGTVPAWLLLSSTVTSTAGSDSSIAGVSSTAGGTDLYDTTANGLQISVTGESSQGVSWNNGYQYNIDQVFAPNSTLPQVVYGLASCLNCVPEYFQPGNTETFTVSAALPLWAANQYQGGTATVTLDATAVQYDNNNGSDCYRGPCSEQTNASNNPFVTSASASSSAGTITLGYNEDVAWSGSLNLNNFTVTDISQSTGTTAGTTCPVTGASGSGTNSVTLTLGACSNGQKIAAGDYLDFNYDSNSSGSGPGAGASGPFIVAAANSGIQSSTSLSLIPVS